MNPLTPRSHEDSQQVLFETCNEILSYVNNSQPEEGKLRYYSNRLSAEWSIISQYKPTPELKQKVTHAIETLQTCYTTLNKKAPTALTELASRIGPISEARPSRAEKTIHHAASTPLFYEFHETSPKKSTVDVRTTSEDQTPFSQTSQGATETPYSPQRFTPQILREQIKEITLFPNYLSSKAILEALFFLPTEEVRKIAREYPGEMALIFERSIKELLEQENPNGGIYLVFAKEVLKPALTEKSYLKITLILHPFAPISGEIAEDFQFDIRSLLDVGASDEHSEPKFLELVRNSYLYLKGKELPELERFIATILINFDLDEHYCTLLNSVQGDKRRFDAIVAEFPLPGCRRATTELFYEVGDTLFREQNNSESDTLGSA